MTRAVHRGLVRLEIEHERTVLDHLGGGASPGAPRSGGRAAPRARRRGAGSGRSRRSGPRASCRSSSWSALTTSRSGRRGSSPLRSSVHMAKAASGRESAQMSAPAQPSSGSEALTRLGAVDRLPAEGRPVERQGDLGRQGIREAQQWFHFLPLHPLPCPLASRHRGRAARLRLQGLPITATAGSRSQQRQVAVELELADVSLVRRPLGPLVADEPLEDVLARGSRPPARSAPSRRPRR